MLEPLARLVGHNGPIYCCTKVNEDTIISSSGDRFLVAWNIFSGEQTGFTVQLEKPAYAIHFDATHGILFVGCIDGTVIAIDYKLRKQLWSNNYVQQAVFCLHSDVENEQLIIGTGSGYLFVFQLDGILIGKISAGKGKIRSIDVHAETIFLTLQSGEIVIVQRKTFNFIKEKQAHNGGANCLCFLSTTELISGGKDAQLKVWDSDLSECSAAYPAHYQTIYGIEKVTNNQFITVSMDKTIKLWDYSTFSVIQRIEGGLNGHARSVNGIVKLSDLHFATYSDDKTVRTWELKNYN